MIQLFVNLIGMINHAELNKMTYEDHPVAKTIIIVGDEGLTHELLEMDSLSFEAIKKNCEGTRTLP